MRNALLIAVLVSIVVLLMSEPVSILPYGDFSLSRIHANTRPDTTQFNPMHVGDRWWFSGYNSMESWVDIEREIPADTTANNEVYHLVIGHGGGLTSDIWQINRGDSIFFLDLENYDDDLTTDELLFFNWGLEEPGDSCWLYRCSNAHNNILPTVVYLCDVYDSPGLDNDTCRVKQFYFEPYDDYGPWPGLAYFEWWAKGYGPFHFEFEDFVSHNIACEIDGAFYGDSTVLAVEEPFEEMPDPIELSCYPNPFNGETHIVFNLAGENNHGTLTIFNIKGQRIRSETIHGSGAYTWDCRNHDGIPVGSGVYLYRITDRKGESKSAKMLYLK